MAPFSPDETKSIYAVAGPRVYPRNPYEPFDAAGVETSLVTCFETQVTRNPNGKAVCTEAKQLTYSELNFAANRIAQLLTDRMRADEKAVGVFMAQGTSVIAAILGILKTGKFYVPLSAVFSASQLAYMIEDSKVSMVLTDAASMALCKDLGVRTINLDEEPADGSPDNHDLRLSPDTIAYRLYTSGSTGRPKAVVQTHRNVLHNVMKYTNGAHICADDRLTLLSAPSFGASVSDIFGALLNGASLYPFDLRSHSFRDLARLLAKECITIYHSVPSIYRSFLSTLSGIDRFPQLRLIKLGGETVTLRDTELYKKHFGRGCLLHVGLGATEMGIIRQFFLDHDTVITGSIVPVGYAVPDTEVVLQDDAGQVVEAGLPGEIVIRSDYLPLGTGSTYHTGDLGMMLADGCLYHLGRKDFQVKIRGYRVELIEVEMALKTFPGIDDAVVLGLDEPDGDKTLVAYLVTSQVVRTNELRRFLRERLPAFMMPSKYVFVDALPQTPNGKVDRLALSQFTQSQSAAGDNRDVVDGSPTEQSLAALWRELLSLNHVGYGDNFFELGGHSLLALKLLARINEEFKVNLPVNSLYLHPTITGLAAVVDVTRTTGPADQTVSGTVRAITPSISTNPPLFIIPGGFGLPAGRIISGNFMNYLASDITLYALIHRSADGRTPGHKDVINMAMEFVQDIRKVQSSGPYFILGACGSGVVAYEIARQLEQSGERVALVAMIDGRYNTATRWFFDCLTRFRTSQYIRQLPKHLEQRIQLLTRGLSRFQSRFKLPLLLRTIKTIGEELEARFHVDPHLGALTPRERFDWQYRKTLRRYRPGSYSGNLKLVLSQEFEQKPVIKEWQQVISGTIEVEFVPGDHNDVLSTYSDQTAAHIERFYREALLRERTNTRETVLKPG